MSARQETARARGAWIVLAGVIVLMTAAPGRAEPIGKEGATVRQWAAGLAAPQGLALDGTGSVYVVENGAGRVSRFAREGGQPTPFATGLQAPAWGLFLGEALYVSERKGNSLARIDASGTVTRVPGEVIDPLGLAPDPKGGLLVVSHRQSVVRRFAPDGAAARLVMAPEPVVAPSEGTKYGWRDIAVGPGGTLYITDEVGRSVLRRKPGAGLETWVTGLSSPSGLAFAPDGRLFVTEEGNGRLTELLPDGGTRVVAEGLGTARDALFLDERTLLVSDRQGGAIWKVTLPR